MKETHSFNVFADYNQFYVMDAVAEPAIPEEVTSEDMERRLRMAQNIVVFHTESAGHVPIEIQFTEHPEESQGMWEHVAEFSLSLPSGVVVICGCTDFVPECPRLEVPPCTYSGRAYFSGAASGKEHYKLIFWPTGAQQGVQRDGHAFGVPAR